MHSVLNLLGSTSAGKHVILGLFIHLSPSCWCCDSPHVQRLSARRQQEAQRADDRWKSRTSALEWKWFSLDSMATKRFKRQDGSEGPGTRCCPDASPPPQLKCSFHESACRSLAGSWRERRLFFSELCSPGCCHFFFFLPDNGRWECLDISGGLLRAWTCHTKFNSVTLRLWLLPCITCECVFSLSLLGNLYAVKTCSSMLLCLPSQRSPEFAPIKHHYSD